MMAEMAFPRQGRLHHVLGSMLENLFPGRMMELVLQSMKKAIIPRGRRR